MDTKYTTVLNSIQTVDQRESFLDAIDVILEERYMVKGNVEETIRKKISNSSSKIILALLSKHKEIYGDTSKFDHFLKDVRSYLAGLPTILLQVPYDFTGKDTSEIYSWFSTNVKKKIVLDIQHEQSLLGGCVIETNGMHKDYSIKNAVVRYFAPTK